jgi:uncharacterized protein with HEPN domain
MYVEIKAWLYDIQNAIDEIEGFLSEMTDDFNAFQNDLKTQRAVERNIEIIGEAMARILQRDESIRLTNARKIVDTRNRIIHGYDSVSNEIIWGIATTHLPILREEVANLLNSWDDPPLV